VKLYVDNQSLTDITNYNYFAFSLDHGIGHRT